MAIIRKCNRQSTDAIPSNYDLIDTPAKLLGFARKNSLETLPLDAEGIAEKLNIEIKKEQLEEDLSGILRKSVEKDSWELLINKNHHCNRQRYTVAHELGHYCLHKHLRTEFQDQIFFRGGETTKEEMQANAFASEILMPESEFRKLVREGTNSIDQLADVFKVSTLALRIKAKSLGMSGHGL